MALPSDLISICGTVFSFPSLPIFDLIGSVE